jgi:hypothetical protein
MPTLETTTEGWVKSITVNLCTGDDDRGFEKVN